MGLFDDVLGAPAASPGGGLFDDVLGEAPAPAPSPQQPVGPTDMVSRLRQSQGLPPADFSGGRPATPDFKWGQLAPQTPVRDLQLGTQGLGAGLADMVGLPVDIAAAVPNLAARAVGLPAPFPKPFMGSQSIQDMAGAASTAVGAPPIDYNQMNDHERLAYNVNRFGGQAAVQGGALAARAPGIIAGAERAVVTPESATFADKASTYLKPLAEPYKTGVGGAVAGDAAASIGSAGAFTAAEQAFPDSPFAQAGASVGGGIAGGLAKTAAVGVPTLAVNATKRVFGLDKAPAELTAINPETGGRYPQKVFDEASRQLRAAAEAGGDNPEALAAALRERAAAAAQFDEVTPSIGPASNNRGLLTLERGARMTDPVAAGVHNDRIAENVSGKVASLRDPNADPEAVRALAERTKQEGVAAAQAAERARVAAAQAEADAAAAAQQQGLQPIGAEVAAVRNRDQAALSQNIDTGVNAAGEASRDVRRGLFRQPVLEQTRVSPDLAVAGADEAMRGVTAATAPESIPAGIVGRIRALAEGGAPVNELDAAMARFLGQDAPPASEGPRITMAQVMDLRSQASTGARQAAANNDGELARRYSAIRDSLNRYIDGVAGGEGPAAEAARAALDYERNVYGPTFKEGPVGALIDAVRADPNRKNVLPEQTAGRLLRTPSGAEGLARAAPQTLPDARRWMETELVNRGGMTGNNNGVTVLNPRALADWGAQNATLIDSVPGFRQDFDRLVQQAQRGDQVANDLAARVQQARRRQVDEQVAAGQERSAAEARFNTQAFQALTGKEPKAAARSVLNGDDPLRQIREIKAIVAGNPEAEAGWKAAVADHLTDTITHGRSNAEGYEVSAARLANEMKKRKIALSEVFSEDEIKKLDRVQLVLEELSRLGKGATPGSMTTENEQSKKLFSQTVEKFLRLTKDAVTAGSQMRSLNLLLDSLPGDKATVESLVKKAIYDIDIGAVVLKNVPKEKPGAAFNPQLNRIRAVGVGAREENDQ